MESIQTRIERFIRTGDGEFDALARDLFAHQFALNSPYQAYCKGLNVCPESVTRWEDIPAVPIAAFKSSDLATFPVGRASTIFRSSATTTGTPSRHFIRDLRPYELSLKESFLKHFLDGDPSHRLPFYILTPSPGDAPHSSLTWMMDVVKRTWGGPGSAYFVLRGRVDEPRLALLLKQAQQTAKPVALLGTTLAFLLFFDYLERNRQTFDLPKGSRLMDTGGLKTDKREISRLDFIQRAEALLGIPESACVNEYGMCELSSQLYGRGTDSQFVKPAWLGTQIINSDSGEAVREGQPGLIQYLDLANVDSVASIRSEDLGRQLGDHIELLGRATGADLKSCSRTAESLLTLS